jgi:hypothetical protein
VDAAPAERIAKRITEGPDPKTQMIDEHQNEEVRKPYEAPKVTRVCLRPDEAVLGHCKIVGQGGPAGGSGSGCLSVTPCMALGS